MRSWWGEGVGSRIAFVVAVDVRPACFHAVVAAIDGVACAAPLPCSRLVDTVPLCWVLVRCCGPCHVPFVEDVGCWVAEMIPVVGIVSIAGVGLLCLPLLCWGCLGCLPLMWGGRWGSTYIPVLVFYHCLMCLHLHVLWLLHLYRVNRWSVLDLRSHLKLQRIHHSLQYFILGSCRRIVFSFLCRRLGQSL